MGALSFNLVDEPWISCTDLAGKHLTFGIRDLLLQAHELRSIDHQNPLAEAALLRVLLAVIHRAVNGPRNGREWKDLYQAGKFDRRIPAYLDKWRQRFDLFSTDAPFYQTPGLLVVDASGNPVPQAISTLMLERAHGNRKTLFDHTTTETSLSVSPPEAAYVLITAQMFSLQGLNRKTTNLFQYQQSFRDGAMVGGIFIVLSGRSFFETLMLNLLVYNDDEPLPNTPQDCPVWERADVGGITPVTPKGYLDFLTCKCRHLLLVPEADGERVFVAQVHLAQGEAFPGVTNPGFVSKRKRDGSWYHPQLDVDRLIWRDSLALFAFDEQIDRRPRAFRQVQSLRSAVTLPARYVCTAFALANVKANPLVWRREKLSIPLSLLSERNTVAHLEKGMLLSEKGATALDRAVRIFMREYLPKDSKDVAEKARATGALRTFWDHLEGHFHQLLLDLDEPESALEKWEVAVKRMARESLASCVRTRYRDSADSYRAWSAAFAHLNEGLANLHE
jgi:CRISPR system Cascade subunit CasA